MAKRPSNAHVKGKQQAEQLTQGELKIIGEQNTDLWRQAQKQRDEYVGSLEIAIRSMTMTDGTPIPQPYMVALLASAAKTRVTLAMHEPAIKGKNQEATISVVWDFDDFIFHSFQNPDGNYIWPKQFVDDFKAMSPMPAKLTDHKALPHSSGYVGWRERMMKQRGQG